MTGLTGDIVPLDTAADTAQTPLDQVRAIVLLDIAGQTIVYAAAGADNQITALRLTANGQLQPFPAGSFSSLPTTDVVRSLLVVEVAGIQYMVAGRSDGVATLRIEPNGALTLVDDIPDSPIVFLNGHRGFATSIEIGGQTYIYFPAQGEDGVSGFRIDVTGNLFLVENESDAASSTNALASVYQVHALRVGGNNFLVATGIGEDAVSTFSIASNGQLTPVDRIVDTSAVPLDAPAMTVSARIGAFTYLFTASQTSDAVTTLLISASGNLSFVSSVSGTSDWSKPLGLEVFEVNGTPFLALTSENIDALTIFGIEDDGSLTEIDTINDTPTAVLDVPIISKFVEIGGRAFLVASSLVGDAVSSFELGANADAVVGTAGGDAIFGFAGNDSLLGDRGNDTLTGGIGNDLLAGGLQNDRIFGGEGNDLLIGDGGDDTLGGGEGNDTLIGGNGSDEMRGDNGDDFFNGSGGADTMVGGNGADTLYGSDGTDSILGGANDDILAGGNANDILFGSDGNDRLFGASGRDLLGGGPNDDTLYGADGSDTLNGGSGRDRIVAGSGFDNIRTGLGSDIVVVKQGDGSDRILDFQNGADRIDLTDFGFGSFAAVNTAASTFGTAIKIDFGGGDELIIQNFTMGQFNAADVIL